MIHRKRGFVGFGFAIIVQGIPVWSAWDMIMSELDNLPQYILNKIVTHLIKPNFHRMSQKLQ